MTTLSERILEAMKDAGFTSQTALAKASGVPQPTINRIINKVATMPDTTTLFKISVACNVSVHWLIDGTGPKSIDERLAELDAAMGRVKPVHVPDAVDTQFAQIKKVTFPRFAGVKKSEKDNSDDDGEGVFLDPRWLEKRGYRKENLIAMSVSGQSMEPTLFEGDIVVVNTADKTLVDGAVCAINYEGEVVVKRVVRDAGDWWLTSDNPDQRRFPRKVYREKEAIIVGRLVQKLSEQI